MTIYEELERTKQLLRQEREKRKVKIREVFIRKVVLKKGHKYQLIVDKRSGISPADLAYIRLDPEYFAEMMLYVDDLDGVEVEEKK